MAKRKVVIERRTVYTFDDKKLRQEYGEEWEDAKKRGLTAEDFTVESCQIIVPHLHGADDLFTVTESEKDVRLYPARTQSAASSPSTRTRRTP